MPTTEKLAERGLPVEWILRCGAFMCFVGHGAFGVVTKEAWVRYFAVAGIGRDMAFTLMPWIGTFDIAMGILMLVAPVPAVAWWMVGWTIWTASLRPLAGEPFAEALERAGNYGAPAVILLLMTHAPSARLFRVGFREITDDVARRIRIALVAATALLLVGHGWLHLLNKPSLVANYASIMSPEAALRLSPWLGGFEILLALLVVLRPSTALLMFIVAWKMITEGLFIIAGSPIWEWVERGGSYCVPLALAVLMAKYKARSPSKASWRLGAHALLLLVLVPIALSAQPATVIVVRHAEKASQTETDPVLSADGTLRATDLAAALRDAGIGSVITTHLQRTKLTAAGVLEATRLTPIVIQAGGANHVPDVVAAIMARPAGEVVLVVGHSNTVGPIITELGGPRIGNICDSQYSNLFILQMTSPKPKLIRANYGKPDPADPTCTNLMK
jgi:phosphohistidine phosphatase SixA